ncbi:cellulase family glycosylhydrolase [Plesiocystis pacifica]|uniref:cellulase family glycosylhydrolase n=1 Tax=Plesiocystis pacifica TaxID=191768 RepID=UPI000A307672|nr:cellulase family glycosylhydrolase [Plesiocystis pacifica]
MVAFGWSWERPSSWSVPVASLAVALAACQGSATPSSSPSPAAELEASAAEPVLVDDFEDGDGRSPLGGYWYVYDDQGNGGGSVVEVPRVGDAMKMEGEGFESERSLEAGYRLDQGNLSYPPFVGIGNALEGPHRDLRAFAALEYSYRGGAHEVRIETANVTEYDFHAMQVPASSTWRTVTLDFALFRQGGWGPKVPMELEDTQALGWQVRGKTGDEGAFELDDVRLLPAGSRGPRKRTLTLDEPAPPAPAQLASMAIDHPLQATAMRSLDRGYNLTNWLEQGAFTGEWTYGEAFVERLAAAGYRSLRLPIDLDLYVLDQPSRSAGDGLQLDPHLFEVLDAFEAWTRAHGLGLTITYHQYDGSYRVGDAAVEAEMVALWGAVAEHFADNRRPDLFFELLNEPELAAGGSGPSAAQWTELSSAMLAAIREHDRDRPVLFGDVKWYDIDALVEREPFDDPNVLYVFHFYEPFVFTHQGASWAGMGTTGGVPYPYSVERWSEYREDFGFSEFNEPWQLDLLRNYPRTGNREAMRNRLVQVKAWAVKHGVPVICNEFGVYAAASKEEDAVRYYTDLVALFAELEIPWHAWFMLMDAETGAVDPDHARALRLGD